MTNNDEKKLDAYNRLLRYGIRPSAPRIAIMQYLLAHQTHATISDIYSELSPLIPTLSKTTVYNTLRMFSDMGAAQMITIDDHHVCYDGEIKPHAHFICRECGCVKDLWNMDIGHDTHKSFVIDGCLIDEVQIYSKGICDECMAKRKTTASTPRSGE